MSLLPDFHKALQAFAKSSSAFRLLRSYGVASQHAQTLYVLDSSFNPPTLAHQRIASSALTDDTNRGRKTPPRLLLLLATQNADKQPQPASYAQRLYMMSLLAEGLVQSIDPNRDGRATAQNPHPNDDDTMQLVVDIGVTKMPYFLDKAKAIAAAEEYQLPGSDAGPEQVHLIGFDTLIRLLDPKYYPPEHNLRPLDAFFDRCQVRVTRRTGDAWGGRKEQDDYVDDLVAGKREAEGARREWATRINLVEAKGGSEESISSSKARQAAERRDDDALKRLLPDSVRWWVSQERLYHAEGACS